MSLTISVRRGNFPKHLPKLIYSSDSFLFDGFFSFWWKCWVWTFLKPILLEGAVKCITAARFYELACLSWKVTMLTSINCCSKQFVNLASTLTPSHLLIHSCSQFCTYQFLIAHLFDLLLIIWSLIWSIEVCNRLLIFDIRINLSFQCMWFGMHVCA